MLPGLKSGSTVRGLSADIGNGAQGSGEFAFKKDFWNSAIIRFFAHLAM